MRVIAALVLAVLAVSVAACGAGDDTSSPEDSTTPITATTRTEVVPTTTTPISGVPSALSGTEIIVRGDLSGTVTDSAGNALGLLDPATGIQRVEIPGGTFLSGGDDDGGQYFLQDEGVYVGDWTADTDDEVVFVVHNHAVSEIAETAATLPFVVRAGDKLSLEMAMPADLGSLALEVEGRADRTIAFGEPVVGPGASDRSPPVSRIEVEHVASAGGKPMARVTITVTERGGAGVARIDYGITPSNKSGVYTKPFAVPAVGEIVVRAIDRGGNIEAPYPRVSLSP